MSTNLKNRGPVRGQKRYALREKGRRKRGGSDKVFRGLPEGPARRGKARSPRESEKIKRAYSAKGNAF